MAVDEEVIGRLLASLPESLRDQVGPVVHPVAQGWDNAVWRVGPRHSLRVPVREVAAPLIDLEFQWVDEATRPLRDLGVRVPRPVHYGSAGPLYPWPWLLVEWVPGVVLTAVPVAERASLAKELARALPALHRRAPPMAPLNPLRGVPLRERQRLTAADAESAHIRLGAEVARRLFNILADAEAAPAFAGPLVWCHGDLHDGNLTLGRTLGMLDFGDLTRGDPAVDLRVLWLSLDADQRGECQERLGSHYDVHVWARARGWAAAFILAVAADATGRTVFADSLEHASVQLGS